MLRSKSLKTPVAIGAMLGMLATCGAWAQVSDDIGPDGLKRRGDGSIDDTQPGGVRPGVPVVDRPVGAVQGTRGRATTRRVGEDIGPDGIKRRGDGTIDDDQAGVPGVDDRRGGRGDTADHRGRGGGDRIDRPDNSGRSDRADRGDRGGGDRGGGDRGGRGGGGGSGRR